MIAEEISISMPLELTFSCEDHVELTRINGLSGLDYEREDKLLDLTDRGPDEAFIR